MLQRRTGSDRDVHDHRGRLIQLLVVAFDQCQQGDDDDRSADPQQSAQQASGKADRGDRDDELQFHEERV